MNNVADTITSYAAAGVAVLPLHTMRNGACTCNSPDCRVLPDGTVQGSPAKHPITRHGKDDATTDIGVIAEWFARYPGCNWGGRPPLGVLVLDVDPRNGGDVELAKLQERHGALPSTLTARTGSGGNHHWLSYNGPARGKLCTGVDVKTNTGYLVLPPSVHALGGTYEWTTTTPAVSAPRWVRTILNPPIRRIAPSRTDSNIDGLIRYVSESQAGFRNDHLWWAARAAIEGGHDPSPLVDAAIAAGLSTTEAEAAVRSALRRTQGAA